MLDVITLILLVVSFIGMYISIWFILLFLEKEGEFHKRLVLKKFPKVSVLIPAHNAEKIISRTLNSLLKIDYPKNKLEVIVVDDGSSDRTHEIVKKFGKKGVKIYKKKWGGKASALNYGLKKVQSNFVLTLDADCFLAKDALKKMVAEMQDKRTMSVVLSIEVFNKKGILQNIQNVEYSFLNFFKKLTASIYCLSVAPAAVLYRTKFFRKYGGFDEKTLTEDFEIGLKITSHQYNIAHTFDGKVYTIVPDTISSLMRQRVRWRYGSFMDLKKHKKMLGLRYGDLGTFILPMILVYTGILITILFLGLFNTVYEFFHSLNILELMSYNLRIFFSINPLQFIDMRIFTLFFVGLIALINFILVRKTKRGKISLFYFVVYILIYSWLQAIFELIAVAYFLLKKKPKW